jgi:uncharacterized protein YfaS (alpha-2-macroglobulin family)
MEDDLTLDARGEAVVVVPVRDAFRRSRIVAVAMDGADRYGTGTTVLQARKDSPK